MAQKQRCAYRFLIRQTPLDAESMLAEEKTVVAREQDRRVLERSRLFELVEQGANSLIDREQHFRAIPDALLAGAGVQNVTKFPHALRRALSFQESLHHGAAERCSHRRL